MLKWLFRKKKEPVHPATSKLDYLQQLLSRMTVDRFTAVHGGTVSIKLITVCSPRVSAFCHHVDMVDRTMKERQIVVPSTLEGFHEQQVLLGDFFKITQKGVTYYEEIEHWAPALLLSVERFIALYKRTESSSHDADRYNMMLLNRMLKNITEMMEGFDEYL